MKQFRKVLGVLTIGALAAGLGSASGGKNPGGGIAPPAGSAELRIFNEATPPGGTVQMKLMLTQPHPISSGGTGFAMDDMVTDGLALSSPLGDSAGIGLLKSGKLVISVISPQADLGTALDYPFLTLTMDVPKTAVAGSVRSLNPANLTFAAPDGPITFINTKAGTLTIGGSLAIRGMWPGGGTWPSGTLISVRGVGFQAGSKLTTKMRMSTPVVISDSEIQFVLKDIATLDQQPITVQNPDRSQVTYYSYLRGVLVAKPSNEILQRAEPAFAQETKGVMTVGPFAAPAAGLFTAVAVQNPNPGPVAVTFTLQSSGASSNVVLPSGGRVMDDVAALLGMGSIPQGDSVTVSSTALVQMLAISADSNQDTLTPFVTAF